MVYGGFVIGSWVRSALILALVVLAGSASAQIAPAAPHDLWWKHAVVYEIYPRSYQDSNGDGIGDLNGITSRLDYLRTLGVDAIWIAPMYPSPQVDFGYDISNYEAVDPQYGTLGDMDRLISLATQRGIRVVLDMVLNHTSDQHEWFKEAASSRKNPKHDWYCWNDGIPADGPGVTAYQKKYEHEGKVPPNNWVSGFGGSAWEWVPAVHQFYYHEFYKAQPDLNWRNPKVEEAMFGAMRFWLDRGVAGFRLDAIPSLFEDPQLRNNPELGGTNAQGDPNVGSEMTDNLPEVHGVIRRMRAMVDKYKGDRVLIGETYLPNTAELGKWYGGTDLNELQLPMDMLVGMSNKLDAGNFRRLIGEAETQLNGAQPLFVFDNHDNERAIDRYGKGLDAQSKLQVNKLLATMLFTSKATSLMYYGEELGMTTTRPTRKEDVKDPIGITGWPKEEGRDGERTPMQWTDGPQAGFSTNPHTWLPIPPSYKTVNVETELKDPSSQLEWFTKLIAMRRQYGALRDGSMTMLDVTNPDVLSYVRNIHKETIVVAINFSAQPKTITLDVPAHAVKTLATDDPTLVDAATLKGVTIAPYSSWIAMVK